jgi:hypothetical protein
MADKAALGKSFGLRPFADCTAEPVDTLNSVDDSSARDFIHLLIWRIAKLYRNGLRGLDTAMHWLARRIQLLQHRDRLMCEYIGKTDPDALHGGQSYVRCHLKADLWHYQGVIGQEELGG